MSVHTDTLEVMSTNMLDCINVCYGIVKTFGEELTAYDSVLKSEEKQAFVDTTKKCMLNLLKCEKEIKDIAKATGKAILTEDDDEDENEDENHSADSCSGEDLLKRHMEELGVDDVDYERNSRYLDLLNELGKSNSRGLLDPVEDDGEDLEAVDDDRPERIPIDPFLQMEVKTAVRNKKCKHVYDRDGIMQYLKQKSRARCPTIGCGNKQVSMDDIVEDKATQAMIDRLRRKRRV